jgi:drug/metabolite transporter (DMT)-like permease
MTFVLGILSALVAPFAMVLGFIIWDNHWSGSAFSLNMYKCNLAAIVFAMVSIYGWLTIESVPNVFTREKVGFLMVSSTIGILIGDWTWLEGMRILGARKVIVMDSLKPFLAAFLGEVFLGERLQLATFAGLILTVIGVSLVGMEKESWQEEGADFESEANSNTKVDVAIETDRLLVEIKTAKTTERSDSYAEQRKNRKQSTPEIIYGMVMAVANVVLHTFGALLTKKYGAGMTTWEINLIRFGFAGGCMILISVILQLSQITPDVTRRVENGSRENAWYLLPETKGSAWVVRISMGVMFVSFLQPALTNYAMFQISLAMLLTLESIGPLYSLPLSFALQNERPTYRACAGAILAVTGIAVLSF